MPLILEFLEGTIKESLVILDESSALVIAGLVIAAVIKTYIPDRIVKKQLGGTGFRPVFMASLLGMPLPLCSCGVLPAAAGLRRQGASRGATTSFLISTPETGADSIAITWALLDPLMTVFRPIAAFVTAIIAGLMENIFNKDRPDAIANTGCGCSQDCISTGTLQENLPGATMDRFRASFRFIFTDLLYDIGPWLLLGIFAAGIISYAIPDDFLLGYLGHGITSKLIMLAAGLPLYVCASSSTPIAAALIMKGVSPGSALVFLLAGPATNAATMTVIGRLLGRTSLAIYLVTISVCAVGFGLFLDLIYSSHGISLTPSIADSSHSSPISLKTAASLVLLVLILRSVIYSRRTKSCSS